MITLGTGVGGGIIINGHLLKGQNGAAGEMHFKMSIKNTANALAVPGIVLKSTHQAQD